MARQIALSFLLLGLTLNVAVWITRSSRELHAEPVAFMTGVLTGVLMGFITFAWPYMRGK